MLPITIASYLLFRNAVIWSRPRSYKGHFVEATPYRNASSFVHAGVPAAVVRSRCMRGFTPSRCHELPSDHIPYWLAYPSSSFFSCDEYRASTTWMGNCLDCYWDTSYRYRRACSVGNDIKFIIPSIQLPRHGKCQRCIAAVSALNLGCYSTPPTAMNHENETAGDSEDAA